MEGEQIIGNHTEVAARDPAAEAVRRQRQVRAREVCIDGLRVLAFIALADDQLLPEELAIEETYIIDRLRTSGISPDGDLVGNVYAFAQSLAVPQRTFSRAVKGVASDEMHFQLVLQAAMRLAAADGKVSEGEHAALIELAGAGRAKGWLMPPRK
jgi:tellurite resistance protein